MTHIDHLRRTTFLILKKHCCPSCTWKIRNPRERSTQLYFCLWHSRGLPKTTTFRKKRSWGKQLHLGGSTHHPPRVQLLASTPYPGLCWNPSSSLLEGNPESPFSERAKAEPLGHWGSLLPLPPSQVWLWIAEGKMPAKHMCVSRGQGPASAHSQASRKELS